MAVQMFSQQCLSCLAVGYKRSPTSSPTGWKTIGAAPPNLLSVCSSCRTRFAELSPGVTLREWASAERQKIDEAIMAAGEPKRIVLRPDMERGDEAEAT